MQLSICAVMATVLAGIGPIEVQEQLKVCASERNDDLRLACFDRLTEMLGSETRATAEADANSQDGGKEDGFGIRGSRLAPREVASEPDSLTAKVTAAERGAHGEFQLSLDNGQVWVEKQANPRFQVRVGDSVTLKRGALSSYRLVTLSGRSTRVTRVQ